MPCLHPLLLQNAISERFRLGFMMHQADPDSVEKKGFKICLTNETGERVDQQKIRLFVTEASTLDRLAGRIRLSGGGNDTGDRSFVVNDKVEALPLKDREYLRNNKDSRYCPAIVTKNNGDGSFVVKYEETLPGEPDEETLPGGSGFNMLSDAMECNWKNKEAWQKTAALALHKSGGLASSTRGTAEADAPPSLQTKLADTFADALGIFAQTSPQNKRRQSVGTGNTPPPARRINPVFPSGLVSLKL
jgi:hypothetical protein